MATAVTSLNSLSLIAHGKVWALVLATAMVAAVLTLGAQATFAQDEKQSSTLEAEPSLLASLFAQAGHSDATRAALQRRGIRLEVDYTGEVFAIPSGGLHTGTTYDGVLGGVLDLDFERLAGWKGGSMHANGYQIHGKGPTAFVDNEFTISNIEALPATRLYELWFEQALFNDTLKVRIGQLAADGDFFASEVSGQFLNGTFGWPGIVAVNLPAGGPAYPLATPGVRVALVPNDHLTVLAAIYNGSPADPLAAEPENDNRYGLDFRLNDPPLVMVETQYSYNQEGGARLLPGTIKIGGWRHFDDFPDQRTGVLHEGNYGVYAVVDQLIFAVDSKEKKGLSTFARVSGNPGDRNPLDFYADTGLTFAAFIAGRPDDVFGFAVGYGHVASRASAADRDAALLVVRDYEAVFEANYRAEILPGLALIPDFQYVWHPGTHVAQPDDPAAAVKDAAIVGVRSTLKF